VKIGRTVKARNHLAHYAVWGLSNAAPGRRYALLPRLISLRDKTPIQKGANAPPGSLFVRDIAQLGRRFSSLALAATNLAAALHGHPAPFPEPSGQQEGPMTLAQLRHQIHAMLGPPPRSYSP
jgi:hypothetical protein